MLETVQGSESNILLSLFNRVLSPGCFSFCFAEKSKYFSKKNWITMGICGFTFYSPLSLIFIVSAVISGPPPKALDFQIFRMFLRQSLSPYKQDLNVRISTHFMILVNYSEIRKFFRALFYWTTFSWFPDVFQFSGGESCCYVHYDHFKKLIFWKLHIFVFSQLHSLSSEKLSERLQDQNKKTLEKNDRISLTCFALTQTPII